MGLVCSALSFCSAAWILPEANQRFRVETAGRPIPRGVNELSLSALRSWRITRAAAGAQPEESLRLAYMYHLRLALSLTPLLFGLFALGLSARCAYWHPVIVAAMLPGLYLGYYWLLAETRIAALTSSLSPLTATWLPNLLTAVLAAALWPRAAQRSAST
uniref:LptF/LptG family permease n=1 Tax=uncultured bacterium 59 TaxID=698390 RepID=E3T6H5_9BACT|nr:hypothetical protein [uncultured bacterium 59]